MAERAKIGQPVVKLGIYPGWGGTVRLPRLIGADNAIEWIAAGKEARAEEALKVGAVDAVVPADKLRDAALDLLTAAAANGHRGAMILLGSMYAAGDGVAADEAAARRWDEMAAVTSDR